MKRSGNLPILWLEKSARLFARLNSRPRFPRSDSSNAFSLWIYISFLHQYLIVANKMAVVCTPPRWAIKPRGGPVIVNSRSRYILVARARVYTEREVERRRGREREGESMKRERGGDRKRERTEKGDDFKGKGEEERTNSWNLVAGLRIVNRRWRENRRRGAAFSNILPVREYIFPS